MPVIPGSDGIVPSFEEAREIAEQVGYPVILKAVAGGGGKGMRLVKNIDELLDGIRAAQSEARSAFGDDSVYIEKYITSPHHIEFQVLGDKHGNIVHLCERECSVQRRHQKVLEETPSPILTPELREKMGAAAVSAAKSVDYEGAGTIEFLVDDNLNFYFLEMNTRLQVEHPITERVIGIDLVKEQIRIANGDPLPFKQKDIRQQGHAIECRIYAEDPDRNFMPSPGVIRYISEPNGLGVRVDGYVYPGYEIPIYYDPMISKLIVHSRTRKGAIDRMKRALYEYKISGVKTSIKFLNSIINHPDFIKGKYDTHFIEKNSADLFKEENPCEKSDCEDIAIITSFIHYIDKLESLAGGMLGNGKASGWKQYGRSKGIVRI